MTNGRKPWPWYMRTRIRAGINWEIFPYDQNCDIKKAFREWLWSPYFRMTKHGDEIQYKDFPSDIGAHFAIDDPNIKRPLRSNYFFLGMALRIVGIDLGFELLYRYKDAY